MAPQKSQDYRKIALTLFARRVIDGDGRKIKAMKITEIPAKPQEKRIIRVAAYARVSSDKDAAFHSLEAQTAYYDEYVSAHADWELVGIYSDNGISGTSIKHRPQFLQMMEDCRAKKIDIILTKSISRFARNTVDLLNSVREMKGLGIESSSSK